MSNRQWAFRILGACLVGIAAMTMAYYVWHLLTGGMSALRAVLRCIALVFLPLAAGTALVVLSTDDEALRARVVRTALVALFAFYLFALFATLVFVRIDFKNYAADRAYYRANWDLMTNFVPFKTVRLYIRCLVYDFIGTTIPLNNLMGNVLLFMPMAGFLPCLFPSMRKFWRFLVLMVALLVAVEALQLVLCCGSCDIDDVILNLAGTLLVYGLLKLPPVKRLLARLYLMQGEAAA